MRVRCTACASEYDLEPATSDLEPAARPRAACPRCGQPSPMAPAAGPASTANTADSPSPRDAGAERLITRMSERISRAAGVQPLAGFSLRETFSEVFARHGDEDVERYFAVGGPDTTPPLAEIDVRWPKPWVFFRMFLLALAAYVFFLEAWKQFGNLNLLPGLILVGSFAIPLSTLMLFFELNVRRNVSLYQLGRLVLVGGAASIVFSLLLYQLADAFPVQWLGASVAGIVEEPGKLLVLAFVVNNRKYRGILNGLLFGAAVGAGFAAFESAGYALRAAMEAGTGVMRDVIYSRGLLSPFGHIVWTAMAAAALWRVKGASRLTFEMLKDRRFTRVFAAAILLHMIWDSPLQLPFDGTYVLLGLIAWVIVLGLVQEGLEELRTSQAAASAAAEPAPTSAPALS